MATDLNKENIEDVYPMSDIQKGLVYHSLRDSAGFVFFNQMCLFFKDREFDPKLLYRAVCLMVKKHVILRTGFDLCRFNETVQIVFKAIDLDIKHYDISHMQKIEQEKYVNARLNEEKKKPFNFEKPEPLWRIRTFALDSENICFVFINHHAILDGWSFACFIMELHNVYQKLKSNPGFVPADLKSTYKNYVMEQIVEKKKSEVVDFWRKELAGFKRLDFSGLIKGSSSDYQTKTYGIILGDKFLDKLILTVKRYNTSVMNLCFAAYAYMLSMLSFQNDVVVGLSINNRPLCEDGDQILGCFINHLPFRLIIPAKIRWLDYINLIDRKLLELRKYQKLSFFEIVKAVGEEKQYQNPLFDTIFNYTDFYIYDKLERSIVQEAEQDTFYKTLSLDVTATFNTLFSFHVNVYQGFHYAIQYYSSVFDGKIIKLLANCFKNVLNKFIYEPENIADKNEVMLETAGQDSSVDFSEAKSYLRRTEFNF